MSADQRKIAAAFFESGEGQELLEKVKFCLVDGAITPMEIGRLKRGLGKGSPDEPRCVTLARFIVDGVLGDADEDSMFRISKAIFAIVAESRNRGDDENSPSGDHAGTRGGGGFGNSFWVLADGGELGPIRREFIRTWIYFGFLDNSILISDDNRSTWKNPTTVRDIFTIPDSLKHWRESALRESRKLESTQPSRMLIARLAELGWPGQIKKIQNYYMGNILRETLEEALPDPTRAPFGDTEWPSWMEAATPADIFENEKKNRNRPPTSRQLEVLEFFLGSDHGLSKFGECRDKISELFSDSEKYNLWNTRNDHKPPTEPQLDRLKWWSRELGEPLSEDLTFGTARDILTEWENRRPDLSSKWRAHQRKVAGQEETFQLLKERIWEECDDASLPRPCEDTLRLCWDLVGREKCAAGMEMRLCRLADELGLRVPEYSDLLLRAISARKIRQGAR